MSASPLTFTGLRTMGGDSTALRCSGGSIAALGPDVAPEPGGMSGSTAAGPLWCRGS